MVQNTGIIPSAAPSAPTVIGDASRLMAKSDSVTRQPAKAR